MTTREQKTLKIQDVLRKASVPHHSWAVGCPLRTSDSESPTASSRYRQTTANFTTQLPQKASDSTPHAGHGQVREAAKGPGRLYHIELPPCLV